jgi:hypothetical protein
MNTWKTWIAATLLALTATAQASLVSQGDGTVLDTTTDQIWLQDWNVDAQQNWATQMAWAESLSFAGSDDWALPSMGDYATLFAETGNLTNVALPFTNVQPDRYWSGTEFQPGTYAWYTVSTIGGQGSIGEDRLLSAVAVRRADVTSSVPEPATVALTLGGLGLLLARRRAR